MSVATGLFKFNTYNLYPAGYLKRGRWYGGEMWGVGEVEGVSELTSGYTRGGAVGVGGGGGED